MKATLSCLLAVMLLSLAVPAVALDEPEQVTAPPPPPLEEKAPPPGPRPGTGPGMPRELPPPRFMLPAHEPLMRMLAERRPELAERLERLRERDPDLFERVLTNAFAVRLERVLDEAEADFKHRMHREGGTLGRREHLAPRRGPQPPEPPRAPEFERHVRELQERHEQLEMRSHELAERLHVLGGEGGEAEERERLRGELTATVNEHFDVRTALRQLELEQIERELRRLHERIEKLRVDFERRQRERGPIVERRVQQLLGDDFGGW